MRYKKIIVEAPSGEFMFERKGSEIEYSKKDGRHPLAPWRLIGSGPAKLVFTNIDTIFHEMHGFRGTIGDLQELMILVAHLE